MGLGKVILVVASILMVAALYLFGSVGPNTSIKENDQESASETNTFSFDELMEEAIATLKPEIQSKITLAEAAVTEADSKEEKVELLNSLVNDLMGNAPVFLIAHYQLEAAVIQNTEDSWMTAGEYATIAYTNEQRNPGLKLFMSTKAANAYENAVELNPENTTARIRLASTYMDGNIQVMEGVQILLAIVDKDPNNIEANLILGRYGIISGQFDKAIHRLETVISQDPSNAEALYFLAEAYSGKGETEKAIRLFEKCKTLVNDPEFSSEIDGYIQRLKNSL